jgi:hypothetical protein
MGEAAEVLREAVEQVERLRAEVLNLDRRERILRENVQTYERLLICLMKLKRYQEALEVAEQGKSRTLIDLLTLRDLRPRNAPTDHATRNTHVSGATAPRIVLLPNRGLAILLLHAWWWEEDGTRKYLLDEFVIHYAPSLSVFKRCLERERTGRKRETLLGVANPTGDLVFSEWECEEIE